MTFDVHADAIDVHRQEAVRRAEWAFTVVMTPAGCDMAHLCNEAAAHLADQVACMHKAFGDFDIIDRKVLYRAESAIVEAFHARMGELLSAAKQGGRA